MFEVFPHRLSWSPYAAAATVVSGGYGFRFFPEFRHHRLTLAGYSPQTRV